jgi:potassium efflux system protein
MRQLLCILGFVALLAGPSPVLAQDQVQEVSPSVGQTAEPPATGGEEPASTHALAASAIGTEARQADQKLLEMISIQEAGATVGDIESMLPGQLESMDRLLEQSPPDSIENLSLRALLDLRKQWSRHKARLDTWQKSLSDRSELLEGHQQELRQMEAVWEKTFEAESASLPPELADRVRSVLKNIREIKGQSTARLGQLLSLQGKISERTASTAELMVHVDHTAEEARGHLLALDVPPLWQTLSSGNSDRSLSDQIRASWERDANALSQFFENYRVRILLHFGFFLMLLSLTTILHRRSRRWEIEDEELQVSTAILSRPLAAALVIALIFTRWIYPQASLVVYELNGLLILLPILRLLPAIARAEMHRPLYILVGLFALDEFRDLAIQETLFARVLLLATTALSLAYATWFLRPQGPMAKASVSGRWLRLIVLSSRVAIALLIVSLLANILGTLALANLLTEGVLFSARIAIILYASMVVLKGLVTILLRTRRISALTSVREHSQSIKSRVTHLLSLVALALWVYGTTLEFQLWAPLVDNLWIVIDYQWNLGAFQLSLNDILAFLIALWVSVWISRLVRFFLKEDVLSRVNLPRGVPDTISMMVHYLILTLGFLVALSAAGIELGKFALLAGALGVGIGFGLQSLVNNIVSGVILLFERPIHLGDTIEVGPLLGVVRSIGIRSSTVRTFDGAEVIVPNGNLISNELINWTLSDRLRRVHVNVGVAYGNDLNQVLEILVAVAKAHPDVLDQPQEPLALFEGFGDSALEFHLRFWVSSTKNWRLITSQVTVAVHDALKESGIEIPFPQRDVHVRSIDAGAKQVLDGKPGPAES